MSPWYPRLRELYRIILILHRIPYGRHVNYDLLKIRERIYHIHENLRCKVSPIRKYLITTSFDIEDPDMFGDGGRFAEEPKEFREVGDVPFSSDVDEFVEEMTMG